jgi:hypothetical protein
MFFFPLPLQQPHPVHREVVVLCFWNPDVPVFFRIFVFVTHRIEHRGFTIDRFIAHELAGRMAVLLLFVLLRRRRALGSLGVTSPS